MAVRTRPTPDEFQNPEPHGAAGRSAVDAVLSHIVAGGNGLITLLSGLLAAVMILYSGYVLYDTFYTQNAAFSSGWELLQYRPEIIDDGATPLAGQNTLARVNQDYRAWLTMYDTNIDYPVMQGEDDLYYSWHNVYGEGSLTGSIYLAAENTGSFADRYNLIYGHHMSNKAMFGGLDDFTDAGYFASHREGALATPIGVYDLYTFAVVETDAYESMVYNVGDRDLDELLDYVQAHAVQADMAAAQGAEKIVALSTCADATTNGRLVVFATVTLRDLLSVTLEGYEGVFDGRSHAVVPTVNYPEGTTFTYSTDGGATWSTAVPSITDVGERTVRVRATNSIYGSAESEATLRVTPKAVTVTANAGTKVYGTADPAFTAVVSGTLNGDSINYTVTRPRTGTDENVGTYPNALVPTGAALQGNYSVTYVPAGFTVTASNALTVTGTGYDGVYDGAVHTAAAAVNVPAGTTIEYSADGGATWTTAAPAITNVGTQTVQIRATNPNYNPVTDTVTLRVTPAAATVTANAGTKVYGEEDPAFTAQVTGVVDGFALTYTVTRPGAEEDVGLYEGSIVPAGDTTQGNYTVTYVPADFRITPADTLSLAAADYTGVYDGAAHAVTATVNVPDGTVIEYSTDGGATWTAAAPVITNVGVQTVRVRATNPNYDPATATVTLRVTPAAVTVTANAGTKVYGEDDPAFTARVTGVIDGFALNYTVTRPRAGTDENAGTYEGAVVPAGNAVQGNYTVTYVPADFRITPANTLALTVAGYTGVYDGAAHAVTATVNVTDGTVIEYSTDGGVTWTTVPPTITNVETQTVQVRAVNPNYTAATATANLRVMAKTVIVRANTAEKRVGENDPVFTAEVEGVLNGDTVVYTVTRPRAGTDEEAGTYKGAIVPRGGAAQGNYIVVFEPADFMIRADITTPVPTEPPATPAPDEEDRPGTIGNAVIDFFGGGDIEQTLENIDEAMTPLSDFMGRFQPDGGTESRTWALVNLICLLLTVYLFVPLTHLKAKFGRAGTMRRFNRKKEALREAGELDERALEERESLFRIAIEARQRHAGDKAPAAEPAEITEKEFRAAVEERYYHVKRFVKRFRWGVGLELLVSIAALVAFLVTEDMRQPMVLIDRWTPLMIAFLLLCWVVDVRLARYRGELPEEEQKEEKQPATV